MDKVPANKSIVHKHFPTFLKLFRNKFFSLAFIFVLLVILTVFVQRPQFLFGEAAGRFSLKTMVDVFSPALQTKCGKEGNVCCGDNPQCYEQGKDLKCILLEDGASTRCYALSTYGICGKAGQPCCEGGKCPGADLCQTDKSKLPVEPKPNPWNTGWCVDRECGGKDQFCCNSAGGVGRCAYGRCVNVNGKEVCKVPNAVLNYKGTTDGSPVYPSIPVYFNLWTDMIGNVRPEVDCNGGTNFQQTTSEFMCSWGESGLKTVSARLWVDATDLGGYESWYSNTFYHKVYVYSYGDPTPTPGSGYEGYEGGPPPWIPTPSTYRDNSRDEYNQYNPEPTLYDPRDYDEGPWEAPSATPRYHIPDPDNVTETPVPEPTVEPRAPYYIPDPDNITETPTPEPQYYDWTKEEQY